MAQSSIVGREHEVGRLTRAVDDAAEGRGSVWYLTGEPGIGKSRLAEEVANLARERGMRTYWGRCWEAGGAPAYWPWVQVLRAVLRTAEPGQLDPHLGPLSPILPEVAAGAPMPEMRDLGPDQARFQLMDAASNLLADASQRLPLVVVLEDLHVADVSTVLLLEFLSATVRHQPLLIVGTFRERELASAPAGPQLTRAAQHGQRVSLGRLSRQDVVAFLQASDETASPDLVDTLHRTTDGHPLFLVEVARLWRAQGKTDRATGASIPRTVRTAIQERLSTVSLACLETLRRGAIVGREFDISLLEACHGDGDYVEAAQEATDAAILVEVAPQRYRFVHFLIRELVYEAIPEGQRASAHARLAEILETRPRHGEQRWSEVAHHLVAAGRYTEAAAAFRKSGSQALHQLAFEEAVQAYGDAIRALRSAGDADANAHFALLLELGHAQTRAGQLAEGKASCVAAAAIARKEGDAEMLARAALEHGTQLIYGKVDTELTALLEEALQGLGPEDSTLRARVMARLAAALQPAEDPDGPMELAREAIAMARRLDHPETLLDTLRHGGSAMVDLGDLEERIVLDREHAVLAEELGNPLETLRGNLRSIMDYLELERLDDAFRAMRACERVADRLQHPAYAWRPVAMRALRALWEGRLDTAEQLIEEARQLGARGGDPNARVVYAMQNARLLQYRGDLERQRPLLRELDEHWDATEMGRTTSNVITGAEHIMAGRTEEGLRGFDRDSIMRLLRLGDHTLQLSVARLSIAAEDRELAEQLYRRMLVGREHLVTGGMLYMTLEGPTSWGLAAISRFLGRQDEAASHYEHALEVTRRTGGRPAEAMIALEYASHLAARTQPESMQRAAELAGVADHVGREVGMPLVVAAAEDLRPATPSGDTTGGPTSSQPEPITMTQAGDSWLVCYENVEFHLEDVGGVRLLATLINDPGREFHVLDLSGAPPEESGAANAVGMGGRERRSGSAAERARVNVQRRIRDAIRQIESYHPGLAKHLSRAVRTGAYCAYEP